jgi:NADH-quinone oxidoreductase subunit D
MFPCYFRIGGLAADLPAGFTEKAWEFVKLFPERIKDYHNLLTKNRIWIARTKDVGVFSKDQAIDWGWSGPMSRGSGVDWDVRRDTPYSRYEDFEFKVPLGENGDTYDRYLVRMEEMVQSNLICRQVLEKMPSGDINVSDPRIILPDKEKVYNTIEGLINHFLLIEKGMTPPVGEVYHAIEAPKGEMGFYIISDGSGHPYRLKVRAPSFINLSPTKVLAKGRLLSDLIALIGTMDIVLADVDR